MRLTNPLRYFAVMAVLASSLLLARLDMAHAASEVAPTAVVAKFYGALLDAMKHAKELGFAGRQKALAPAIENSFNLSEMTRISVGQQWANLTDEQRQRLVQAFSHYTIATYASRFDGYSGEKFEVQPETLQQARGLLVQTKLVPGSGDTIELNYLMQKSDDGWRIIDVYLSGTISELANRRSEFSSVLNRDGADALVALINEKTAGLQPGTSAN